CARHEGDYDVSFDYW
nr:immunoglobulin heavy chain junction region [Mus musculus]